MRTYRATRETLRRYLPKLRARRREGCPSTWQSNPSIYEHVRTLYSRTAHQDRPTPVGSYVNWKVDRAARIGARGHSRIDNIDYDCVSETIYLREQSKTATSTRSRRQ